MICRKTLTSCRLFKLVSGIHIELLPGWVFCLFEQNLGFMQTFLKYNELTAF